MSKHKITEIIEYSETIFTISFERNNIEFIPGACVSIKGKPYSIASSPKDSRIQLCVRRLDNGRVSGYLHSLTVGDEIEVDEVFNYFKPGADCEDGKFIYFATGVGISPFLSALRYYKDIKPKAVYYGGRTYKELVGFASIITRSPNTYYALSRRDDGFLAPKHINEPEVLETIVIDPEFKYYLCGVDAMINEISTYLMSKGVRSDQIISELFFMR